MESTRRLAAILFTDIVGYTAMMQRDEKQALAAVHRHQAVLEQCVPLHHGTIQQYYGDGSLSIFSSATDAMHCALQLQMALQQDPVVPLRVGMHIGEIYTEDGKIFGDGVNLASRIESIGQPGTVLFSRDVYEKVRNQTEFEIIPLGTFAFKNVEDKVEVFALANPGIRIPDKHTIEGKLKEQPAPKGITTRIRLFAGMLLIALVSALVVFLLLNPEEVQGADAYRNSIAVLPFSVSGGEPDDEFLGTGLAEDILTQLAQIAHLKVIARSSILKYKDYESSDKSLSEIARELGVNNILEGSVRKFSNTLRITVRLVNPKDESVIWAEEFDREMTDVLNMQREIAIRVSDKLKLSLTPQLMHRLSEKVAINPDAYVHYHRGQETLRRSSGSKEEIARAIAYFEAAINADSGYSRAWVGLADAYLESIFWHRRVEGNLLQLAMRAVEQALKIDPEMGEAYGALGAIHIYEGDLRQAQTNLQRAMQLSPGYTFTLERQAWIEYYLGNHDAAIGLFERVILLDPLSTRSKGSLGNLYYFLNRWDDGLRREEEFLRLHPGDNFILWVLAYLHAGKGNYETAIDYLNKRTIGVKTNWVYAYCYAKLGRTAEAQAILDYHIEREKRDYVPEYFMAVIYNALGDTEGALTYLSKIRAGGEGFFAWGIPNDPMFDNLRDNPRFKQIVKNIFSVYKI